MYIFFGFSLRCNHWYERDMNVFSRLAWLKLVVDIFNSLLLLSLSLALSSKLPLGIPLE